MLVGADPFLAEFDRLAHQVFGTGEGAGMPVVWLVVLGALLGVSALINVALLLR